MKKAIKPQLHPLEFYLSCLRDLPSEFLQNLREFKNTVQSRAVLALTLQQLCDQILIKTDPEDLSDPADFYCRLSQLLDHFDLKPIPGFIPLTLNLNSPLYVALKPSLNDDEDCARVRTLMEKSAVPEAKDLPFIQRARAKIRNYQLMLNFFAALFTVCPRRPDSRQRSFIDSLLSSMQLTISSRHYLRACYTFAAEYADYPCDLNSKVYPLPALSAPERQQLTRLLAQTAAASDNGQIQLDPCYPDLEDLKRCLSYLRPLSAIKLKSAAAAPQIMIRRKVRHKKAFVYSKDCAYLIDRMAKLKQQALSKALHVRTEEGMKPAYLNQDQEKVYAAALSAYLAQQTYPLPVTEFKLNANPGRRSFYFTVREYELYLLLPCLCLTSDEDPDYLLNAVPKSVYAKDVSTESSFVRRFYAQQTALIVLGLWSAPARASDDQEMIEAMLKQTLYDKNPSPLIYTALALHLYFHPQYLQSPKLADNFEAALFYNPPLMQLILAQCNNRGNLVKLPDQILKLALWFLPERLNHTALRHALNQDQSDFAAYRAGSAALFSKVKRDDLIDCIEFNPSDETKVFSDHDFAYLKFILNQANANLQALFYTLIEGLTAGSQLHLCLKPGSVTLLKRGLETVRGSGISYNLSRLICSFNADPDGLDNDQQEYLRQNLCKITKLPDLLLQLGLNDTKDILELITNKLPYALNLVSAVKFTGSVNAQQLFNHRFAYMYAAPLPEEQRALLDHKLAQAQLALFLFSFILLQQNNNNIEQRMVLMLNFDSTQEKSYALQNLLKFKELLGHKSADLQAALKLISRELGHFNESKAAILLRQLVRAEILNKQDHEALIKKAEFLYKLLKLDPHELVRSMVEVRSRHVFSHLNLQLIQSKLSESLEVQSVIGKIREENEEEDHPDPVPETKEQNAQISGESASTAASEPSDPKLALLKDLPYDQDSMPAADFAAAAQAHGFMSDGAAIEEINEWAFDQFDEPLLEADPESGIIYLTSDLIQQALAQA